MDLRLIFSLTGVFSNGYTVNPIILGVRVACSHVLAAQAEVAGSRNLPPQYFAGVFGSW